MLDSWKLWFKMFSELNSGMLIAFGILLVFVVIFIALFFISRGGNKNKVALQQKETGAVTIESSSTNVGLQSVLNRITEIETELNIKHKGRLPQKEIRYRTKLVKELEQLKRGLETAKVKPLLGMGSLKAYVFRNDALEVTTIPEPMGNIFYADPSMPVGGPTYLVAEVESGRVEAYDPRTMAYFSDMTPQMAYFATHWDIVKEVFKNVNPWWQSAPLWVTIVIWVGVFLTLFMCMG